MAEPMETRQFRLPTAVLRALEELASRNHATVADSVRRLLVDGLRAAGIPIEAGSPEVLAPSAPADPRVPVPPPVTAAPKISAEAAAAGELTLRPPPAGDKS